MTDRYVEQIEQVGSRKEQDIMEIQRSGRAFPSPIIQDRLYSAVDDSHARSLAKARERRSL